MPYSREELALLNYKELRKLCKQTGVKANKKHFELVNDLVEYFQREENELQELEEEMKMYETIDLNVSITQEEEPLKGKKNASDLNGTFTYEGEPSDDKKHSSELNGTYTHEGEPSDDKKHSLDLNGTFTHKEEFSKDIVSDENERAKTENNQQLKDALMKEVERRAEEKLSKIPRLVIDNVIIPKVSDPPAVTPDVGRTKNSHGIKMDSIDKYLEKKQKRASAHLKFNEDFKENTLPAKRMKFSASSSALKKRSVVPKRKSVKIDSEITDFSPKVKSTPNPRRVSPRIEALKETNRPRPDMNNSSSKKDSQQENQTAKRSTISSPVVLGLQQTPKTKTPIKFDLKASLKKPLSYKPHTGKLKEVYFTQENNVSLPRSKVEKLVDRKVSIKERTKNITTRERRREEAASKRSKNRLVVLDKRRGIVA